jgi:N6-adenosine-specific RNA methylase IME4
MTAWEGLEPPYSTIVADPPWHYDTTNAPNPLSGYGTTRPGFGLGYSTMTLDEVKALPVGDLGSDARCFLWTTNRYLFDAPDVLRAWGFEHQARVIVWCKPPMGTQTITTEFVVIGKRGNPPRMPWIGTTWYEWPRTGLRRSHQGTTPSAGHSRKPAPFLDLVESWCPGPYVELFARAPRLGWDSWGKGYEEPS